MTDLRRAILRLVAGAAAGGGGGDGGDGIASETDLEQALREEVSLMGDEGLLDIEDDWAERSVALTADGAAAARGLAPDARRDA